MIPFAGPPPFVYAVVIIGLVILVAVMRNPNRFADWWLRGQR